MQLRFIFKVETLLNIAFIKALISFFLLTWKQVACERLSVIGARYLWTSPKD